jgi:hypothetical protein
MARLTSTITWILTWLGGMLLAVSPFLAPAYLFADAGSDCQLACGSDANCIADCCATTCGGDDTCASTCCSTACNGDPTCFSTCSAFQASLTKCSLSSCQGPMGVGCMDACRNHPCDEGGLDPNKGATCCPITTGCRCRY